MLFAASELGCTQVHASLIIFADLRDTGILQGHELNSVGRLRILSITNFNGDHVSRKHSNHQYL